MIDEVRLMAHDATMGSINKIPYRRNAFHHISLLVGICHYSRDLISHSFRRNVVKGRSNSKHIRTMQTRPRDSLLCLFRRQNPIILIRIARILPHARTLEFIRRPYGPNTLS